MLERYAEPVLASHNNCRALVPHQRQFNDAQLRAIIARDLDYHDFVFSMKSSNPKVMIEAYRLLVTRLAAEGADWNYPIHLGVTEAGDGEDGRIKSAIGIGSLLNDGIGDTIRVSLAAEPQEEGQSHTKFRVVFDAIRTLLNAPDKKTRKIGFRPKT